MRIAPFLLALGILGLAGLAAWPANRAYATLGGNEASVETVRAAISGTEGSTEVHSGYHVRTVSSGHLGVREYISPAGKVFAVTWMGSAQPDLAPILGSYLPEYTAALWNGSGRTIAGKRLRLSSRIFKTAHLVVEKAGHLRAIQGRAYLPEQIPGGIDVREIR